MYTNEAGVAGRMWVPNGTSAVIAMIGDPVAQTVLPGRLNALFAARGVDAVVAPFALQADAVAPFLEMLRGWRNCRGAVVTAPHKQAVRAHLQSVSEAAAVTGAVNVVVRDSEGGLVGSNIDGAGFVAAMAGNGVLPAGRRAIVFGCGGAGAAIGRQLLVEGARSVLLCDRDRDRARKLAARLGGIAEACDPPGSVARFDLLVNATSVGLFGAGLVHDLDGLSRDALVADVVTEPPMTPFLVLAASKGARVQTGPEDGGGAGRAGACDVRLRAIH